MVLLFSAIPTSPPADEATAMPLLVVVKEAVTLPEAWLLLMALLLLIPTNPPALERGPAANTVVFSE